MNDLPTELLNLIAYDSSAYYALLAVPIFARSPTQSIRCDYMIRFGYSIEITCGDIRWKRDGKHHRTDGPAVIHADGTQLWYINGTLHRLIKDGPAVIHADGSQVWSNRPNGRFEWYIHSCEPV
jgi:hypothetical protein